MTATTERPRDQQGRYRHEWGVVGQDYSDGCYVEIYGCETCDKFQTSATGTRLLSFAQLRAKYPNAIEADSRGVDEQSLYPENPGGSS